MKNLKTKKILDELKSRTGKKFDVEKFCFKQQLDFIQDPSDRKVAVTGRRSGKSYSCAADLINTCFKKPGASCIYITLVRQTAKKVLWEPLKVINREYKLGLTFNETELKVVFKNGSIIYLSGAGNELEIEKFRGMSNTKIYIDEAQSFKPYIEKLIKECLIPTLWDQSGSLIITGTPGPICSGYFYNISQSTNNKWKRYHWTMRDNIHILQKSGKTAEEIWDKELEDNGMTKDDPAFQREALGIWVQDENSLVFKYDVRKNDYFQLPEEKWNYIFGIDLGYNDADAIAVLAYSDYHDKVYLVEEDVQKKQGITELMDRIKILQKKYRPVKMKIDQGGLGKKIAEELRQRHSIPVEAAEKSRKFEFIELLNDDLRTERLKIKRSSLCAQDYKYISWDYSTEGVAKVSASFHSDIADAVLYAWREAKHFAAGKRKVKPKYDSEKAVDEWWDQEDEDLQKKKQQEWWEKL